MMQKNCLEMHDGSYGTHVPILAAALALVPEGDVLELGSGWWSTNTLHVICKAQGRRVVTADTDQEWLARFEYLNTGWHELVLVGDWRQCTLHEDRRWAVVLVDHSPAEMRGESIRRLRGHAELIVVHDTQDMGSYGYAGVLDSFKYRYDHNDIYPFTTVLSDDCQLPW